MTYRSEDIDAIAGDYFTELDAGEPHGEDFDRFFAGSQRIEETVLDDPRAGLELILALVERAPTDAALGRLAAGPLEDFILVYGLDFVDALDLEAARNLRFRQALWGTWGWEEIPAVVGDRLLKHFPDDLRTYWQRRRFDMAPSDARGTWPPT